MRAKKLQKRVKSPPSDLHRARSLPRQRLAAPVPRRLISQRPPAPAAVASARRPAPVVAPRRAVVEPPDRTSVSRQRLRPPPAVVHARREVREPFQDREEPILEDEALPLEPALEDELEGVHQLRAVKGFGPPARLGEHLRIQAQVGHRAGVIELRPGLFLVAEVPVEAMQRPEFGAALLVPLVTSVAVDVLTNPKTQTAIAQAARNGVEAISQAARSGGEAISHQLAMRRDPYPPAPSFPNHHAPQLLGPPRQSSPVPWANDTEIAGVIGCDGHLHGQCKCGWRTP